MFSGGPYSASGQGVIGVHSLGPKLLDSPNSKLTLATIQGLLEQFRLLLCNANLTDPRGYRVRFNLYDFVHFIKLVNEYGEEPRNRKIAVENIRRGRISLDRWTYNRQRAADLGLAPEIAKNPDFICSNWNPEGEGDECYVKNFGGPGLPNKYRVLVCVVRGQTRYGITIFPCEVGAKERAHQIWP